MDKPPTTLWAWRNGMPCWTSHSARSTAATEDRLAASCMRSPSNVTVVSSPVSAASPSRDWSIESKNGSLSSWRSRV